MSDVLLVALNEAVEELRTMAEQLEVWADESRSGGWSTHQVKPMREKAIELRSMARRLQRSAK